MLVIYMCKTQSIKFYVGQSHFYEKNETTCSFYVHYEYGNKISKRASLRGKWKVGTVAHACTPCSGKLTQRDSSKFKVNLGNHCEYGIQGCRARQFQN